MIHKIPTETHLRTWNPEGDAFGRQKLAERVVENILTKMETPNVLGIYGDWGTGKTTFLHYLQMVITGKRRDEDDKEGDIKNEELKTFRDSFKGDLDKIAIVHFEPWKYEYAEGTDLLLKLIEKIEDSLPAKTKAWKKLKKIIKDISGEVSLEDFLKDSISFFIFLFSFFLPSGSQIFANIQKAILSIGLLNSGGILNKIYFLVKKRDNFKKEDPFEQVGELFIKAIDETIGKGKNKEKIIIFIDDLDRCLPENTIKLLEAIKNFLFQDKVIFVLALDRLVVSEMIEKKYGLHGGYGIAYLEKLIQYPIILKNPDLVSEVESVFASHDISLPKVSINLIANLLKNHSVPRRAKAILRQFIMHSLVYSGGKTKFFSFLDEPRENIDEDLGGVQYVFFAFFLLESFPRIFTRDLNKNWEVISSVRSNVNSGTPIDERLNLGHEELSRLVSIFRDAPIKDASNRLNKVILRNAMEFILKH